MRVAFVVLGLACLAACGESAAPIAPKPPEVRIVRVGAATSPATLDVVGTVGLRRETTLGFTSAGRIAAIRVEDGDAVQRGQLLAALDTTVVASDLSSARAERERAALEYTRSAKLLEQGWVTRSRVDNARATLAAADARVRATGFQSSNAAIVAPGPGRILSRVAEPGQVVAAGTPVLVLGEESGGYVLRVPLTDRAAQAMTVGTPATVTLSALGGAALTGRVVELAGRADRATGTFTAEILLPPDARLRAGQLGSARIVGRATTTALTVPPAAVFSPRAGEGFVYVVDPAAKRAYLRKVALAEATDGGTQVTGGLKAGEFVATSRIDRLADKMAIAPIGSTR